MPSRKRSRTPPAAPAPAAAAQSALAAPARTQVPSLRETFERRHVLAIALLLVASVPAVLELAWDRPAHSAFVVVIALILLAAAAWIFDVEQWIAESRRQMLLTLGFGALAAATAPAVPFGLL